MTDLYDLTPQAFAKALGLVIPKNGYGYLSYPGLLNLAIGQYYDRNPHLSRPLAKAS
jgi:hypothetical protein